MLNDINDLVGTPLGQNDAVSVAILAGGLSRRFGRDKSRLKVGPDTLLKRIRDTALRTGYPVSVIRKDRVPRCGPLGGIITAFARSRADLVVFLACDMPGVSANWIERVARTALDRSRPVFSSDDSRLGFPLALFRRHLAVVESSRQAGLFSLKHLAAATRAVRLRIARDRRKELRNINTPEDWAAYRSELDS